MKSAGFTLLEVMLVMALVAAGMALVAAFVQRASPGAELRAQARNIAQALRQTRMDAIRAQKPQRFLLDVKQHQWRSETASAHEIPEAIQLTMTSAREVQPAPDMGAIVFYPDGASTGGQVALRRGDAKWVVDVHWVTGRVDLQRTAQQ